MPRTRRGRGEGSIYQRADGVWCASVSAGYAADGRRRRRTVYGATKGEVQDKLRQCHVTGVVQEARRLRVGDYLDRWLENTARPTLARGTHVRYETIVKHQLKPHIGGVLLAKLEPLHIEQLYGALSRGGASPRTQQLAGIVLGRALKHAVALKLIGSNPVRDVPKPRVARREMQVWNAPQVAAFLAAAKADRLFAVYALALGGGLRQGEIFGLAWSDIDFAEQSLIVARSLDEVRGQFALKEPKTGKGRKVDLPQFVMRALHRHRLRALAEGRLVAGSVFTDERGGWLRKSNVQRRSFAPLTKRSGAPVIRFHDLRHTHATMLLMAGENVKVVSERLGHRSIEITLNTYAHCLPTMQKGAAQRLDRLFA